MSSTRRAKDNSVFHQSRFASSEEFERGLLANLVAKRAALLDDKSARELIWFIQYLSHQEGGLAAVAKDLLAKYPDRNQTPAMAEMRLRPGQICNAKQVKRIRSELSPDDDGESYMLHGEMSTWQSITIGPENEDRIRAEVNAQPESYPAKTFIDRCCDAAENGLENHLKEICLNPEIKLGDGSPWYFPTLISTLREYQKAFVQSKSAGVVVTELGAKVCEVLEYTAYSRGLTLMQGEARLGKSFAAKQSCIQNPGQRRYAEVPPSNDDATFFRALARALGQGSFLRYKVAEVRERVESVLLTGDLLLVLDESHRLWPQMNLRYGFPSRINWVMAMANQGVPICCIATPQFIECQKSAQEKSRWNSAQLTGRISHFETLPTELSREDLMAVAKSVLPEASAAVIKILAIYASTSARYLAAIDAISKRARYIATRAGRADATTEDVRKAMQESVVPADTKLIQALESGKRTISAQRMAKTVPEATIRADLADEPLEIHRGSLTAPGPVPGARAQNDFSPALMAG